MSATKYAVKITNPTMAQYQSHISLSLLIAIVYSLAGVMWFGIYPEHALLAAVIIVIAGMLPDIDASSGVPARELSGLLAAVTPMIILQWYPSLKIGGMARIALVVIFSYILTRFIVSRFLQKFTARRGMIHSIPASIITFELTYLIFWDLFWKDRMYIALAAFVGFFSHLVIDGYSNLDIIGKILGRAEKKQPALKVVGDTWGTTVLLYGCAVFLGWIILRDAYPGLRIFAGVRL